MLKLRKKYSRYSIILFLLLISEFIYFLYFYMPEISDVEFTFFFYIFIFLELCILIALLCFNKKYIKTVIILESIIFLIKVFFAHSYFIVENRLTPFANYDLFIIYFDCFSLLIRLTLLSFIFFKGKKNRIFAFIISILISFIAIKVKLGYLPEAIFSFF